MEVSIVMPCLNEADALETCIAMAQTGFRRNGISSEIAVAGNGSTDGSQAIAARLGARGTRRDEGIWHALMGGITAARGKFIVMRDADDSYDFIDFGPFVDRLGQDTSAIQRHRPEGRHRQTPPQTHPEPIEVPHLD